MNLKFMIMAIGICLSSAVAAIAGEMTAPDFELKDTTGQSHLLSSYRGGFVVLEWTNYDCPFVKKHYGSGNMQALQQKYTDRGVIWLSICSSATGKQGNYSPAEWNQMIKEREAHPTAVLLDETGKVGQLYGAKTTPHIFIIDPDGTVIYRGAIDSKPSWNPKDIEGAENYIALTLDAAMDGKDVAVSSTQPYGCSVKY